MSVGCGLHKVVSATIVFGNSTGSGRRTMAHFHGLRI
jgi:hypothetical protein